MVSLESREILVPRERGENSECPAPEERTDPRGRRVVSDPLVSSGHSDWSERRVNLASLDFLAILEDSDPRDRSDSRASQDPTERRERGV